MLKIISLGGLISAIFAQMGNDPIGFYQYSSLRNASLIFALISFIIAVVLLLLDWSNAFNVGCCSKIPINIIVRVQNFFFKYKFNNCYCFCIDIDHRYCIVHLHRYYVRYMHSSSQIYTLYVDWNIQSYQFLPNNCFLCMRRRRFFCFKLIFLIVYFFNIVF